ncbi:NfuA family Fe-S biogenesis protein [Buchnera aphidicola (Aphis craccivora)]|uniref:Fe/S biogenesis protein NfuA n=2 Tax=cellular organisms TaxID=131567 RepID=A0A6G0W2K3_APHCR|nr:NfuA family Fe-S biogenesis protein [Buchnera aphidicola]KAF0716322.1 Fe/S biogenesis protein NfuA [Aphis craccivora]QCI16766.1 NfuA family Fe-S biogenesis protein [Buchnera aphidicola (Aphis craccivora)]QLL40898.1 NfuA family Fe-S biogenesis protein [Buchnera aphidicola (Aphis craccivore)]WAI17740.1 MAG: NfuA family Fe-S biogenesis protein [Buchnera aphidicola (Aphis craccivora)]
MIKISNQAQNYFISLLSKEPKGTQIRVFIINPGMQNAECKVAYCSLDEIEESDIKLEYNNFYVYVNKSIIHFLKNSEIDLIVDKLNSQLTFKAPYAKKNISNQQLSLKEQIKNFLNIEINPQLLLHGGKINLINISENNTVFIEFSGGCNGCSMIGVTLKEMVERKILSSFPEIKKVIDQTQHLHGHHSFY